VATPKTILNPLKFLKEFSCAYTFEAIDYLRDLLVRLHTNNNVYVVNFVFSCQQFNILLYAQFFQYFSQSITYFSRDYCAAIFHAPNDVYLKLMYRMTGRLKVVFHTKLYANQVGKLRKTPVKSVFFALLTNIGMRGIEPLSRCQIPPQPKGVGSPLVGTR
jgi:hypothetical protein